MKTKIQKVYVDTGFGFPVRLLNVPMVHVRGVWTPKINTNELAVAVLHALGRKAARLTGNQIRFIRHHFEMTLQDFARRFCVSHVAVLKWERAGNRPVATHWTTEKDMLLFVLSRLKAKPGDLARLYEALEIRPAQKAAPMHLDARELAA